MPGRATSKRAGAILLLLAALIGVTACASTDHSWRGEFDARLEGASAAIKETSAEWSPAITTDELLRTSIGLAQSSYDLQKNMIPYLQRHYRGDFEGEVAALEELEREAAHCQTA
jgi:hypothetical protein